MIDLVAKYDAAVACGDIEEDQLQKAIVERLQDIAQSVHRTNTSWWSWFSKPMIKGLYIYGPVGAGKTYLVDLFFTFVEEPQKARFHFHHFMQQVDAQLRKRQGQKNPLVLIAKNIARTARILCFDEFFVQDVAHAMILAELLQALTASGVILVISSNTPPDELYLNGVHRERFLPAIEAIKSRCDVMHLEELRDYRLGRQPLAHTYFYPLSPMNQQSMTKQFENIATEVETSGFIRIQNRDIAYVKRASNAIWFSFPIICSSPRSQLDYLEIADQFDTFFLSDLPALGERDTLAVIMFIHLIDVLYDRGVKTVISAAVPPGKLYLQGEMSDIFKRTLSRLMEMQSADYLSRHPRRDTHLLIDK